MRAMVGQRAPGDSVEETFEVERSDIYPKKAKVAALTATLVSFASWSSFTWNPSEIYFRGVLYSTFVARKSIKKKVVVATIFSSTTRSNLSQ